ncbi:hypothetical protein R6Q59_023914, partial [Mikania micrantha]
YIQISDSFLLFFSHTQTPNSLVLVYTPRLGYIVHRPPITGDDDQRSSDSLHPPLHRDDHLRSRPEPGERGTLWGGAFVTHIARSRGLVDMLPDPSAIKPRKLNRRTIVSMKLVADIPGRPGHHRAGAAAALGRWFDAAARADSGGAGSIIDARGVAAAASTALYRAVSLNEPLEALLHHIAVRFDEMAQQMAEADRCRAA